MGTIILTRMKKGCLFLIAAIIGILVIILLCDVVFGGRNLAEIKVWVNETVQPQPTSDGDVPKDPPAEKPASQEWY